MDIGIIGAGEIGGSLTRRLSKLGHKVWKIAELPEDLFDGIGPQHRRRRYRQLLSPGT